jgi:hypothetical protein
MDCAGADSDVIGSVLILERSGDGSFLLYVGGLVKCVLDLENSPYKCQKVIVTTEMTAIAIPVQIHLGLWRNELLLGFSETRIASGLFKISMASSRALCKLSTESVRSSFFSAVASWMILSSSSKKQVSGFSRVAVLKGRVPSPILPAIASKRIFPSE